MHGTAEREVQGSLPGARTRGIHRVRTRPRSVSNEEESSYRAVRRADFGAPARCHETPIGIAFYLMSLLYIAKNMATNANSRIRVLVRRSLTTRGRPIA